MKYLALERVLRRTGVGKIALPSFPEVSREYLEFLSIKLPGALLTSKLQHIKPGDRITVGHQPTGTLRSDYLLPGKPMWPTTG